MHDRRNLQSEEQVRNMCVGFAQLDDRSRESFPEFPTVEEMKKTVRLMSTPSIVGPTVFYGTLLTRWRQFFSSMVIIPKMSRMISGYEQAILSRYTSKGSLSKNTRKSWERYWRFSGDVSLGVAPFLYPSLQKSSLGHSDRPSNMLEL